jgi:hypothetical protein
MSFQENVIGRTMTHAEFREAIAELNASFENRRGALMEEHAAQLRSLRAAQATERTLLAKRYRDQDRTAFNAAKAAKARAARTAARIERDAEHLLRNWDQHYANGHTSFLYGGIDPDTLTLAKRACELSAGRWVMDPNTKTVNYSTLIE